MFRPRLRSRARLALYPLLAAGQLSAVGCDPHDPLPVTGTTTRPPTGSFRG